MQIIERGYVCVARGGIIKYAKKVKNQFNLI